MYGKRDEVQWETIRKRNPDGALLFIPHCDGTYKKLLEFWEMTMMIQTVIEGVSVVACCSGRGSSSSDASRSSTSDRSGVDNGSMDFITCMSTRTSSSGVM